VWELELALTSESESGWDELGSGKPVLLWGLALGSKESQASARRRAWVWAMGSVQYCAAK